MNIIGSYGSFHANITLKNAQNEIVFGTLGTPLSILLFAAIRAKLIGPHGDLQVDKQKFGKVTGSVDSPNYRKLRSYQKKKTALSQFLCDLLNLVYQEFCPNIRIISRKRRHCEAHLL